MHCSKKIRCYWHSTLSSLTSHEQKKNAVNPTHDSIFFIGEVDKLAPISVNIAMHIIIRLAWCNNVCYYSNPPEPECPTI